MQNTAVWDIAVWDVTVWDITMWDADVSHQGVGTAVRDVAVGVSTMWDIAVKDVVQDTAVENTVGCYCRFLWSVSLLYGTWWDMC